MPATGGKVISRAWARLVARRTAAEDFMAVIVSDLGPMSPRAGQWHCGLCVQILAFLFGFLCIADRHVDGYVSINTASRMPHGCRP